MVDLLKPTSDRKTRFYSTQQNTFGLMPGPIEGGGTCPGCTQLEGGCWFTPKGRKTPTCYVAGLLGAYKGVRGILEHNTALLRGAGPVRMLELLSGEFTRFEAAEAKRAKRLSTVPFRYYRLHWSGDLFSRTYTQCLAEAMAQHPDTKFWTYTRSFAFVPELTHCSNLMLYLSADPVNVQAATECYLQNGGTTNPNLAIAYMAKRNDFHSEVGVKAAFTSKGMDERDANKIVMGACPVDLKKLALEEGCAKCARCTQAGCNRHVWFRT